jgi:hypothetical protein
VISAEAAGAVEALTESQEGDAALSLSTAASVSAGVLVLFVFMALGLLVGLLGGVRALHGRLRDG